MRLRCCHAIVTVKPLSNDGHTLAFSTRQHIIEKQYNTKQSIQGIALQLTGCNACSVLLATLKRTMYQLVRHYEATTSSIRMRS
jgi:hypothetical protein